MPHPRRQRRPGRGIHDPGHHAAQRRPVEASDARVQASNELLKAYRTINYYAWGPAFRERVLDKRRVEMELIWSRFIWRPLSSALFSSLPFIATLVSCFFYTVVWGNELGVAVAFPALATFAVIKISLNMGKFLFGGRECFPFPLL